jgi:hypothetical protein
MTIGGTKMKKTIALILTAVLAVTLFGISVGADDYEHVIFINRDGILFNGNVGTLTPGTGDDEVDVEEYLGGTIEISGWCVTDVEIQQYGYTVDGGEFIASDYVNNVEADANAIRAQMAKFEDAVDAARFWVVIPTQPGDHTIEVYLKTDDVMDLLWTVETYGGKDPNATEAPTKAPTEAPTESPTEGPTEVPATDVPVSTEKTGENGDNKEAPKKNSTGLIVGIIIGVVAVAAIVTGIILAKRKKK